MGAYAMACAALARLEMAQDHVEGAGNAPAMALEEKAPVATPRFSRRNMLWMAGSAIAASAVGAVSLIGASQRYATSRGEMLRIALSDGSVVNLNTASRIDVQFTPEARTVFLDGGEVLFDVAKDAKRPFVVVAGETRVRAVGTAFTVRRDSARPVDVMVSEGVVEVSQDRIGQAPVRLSEGMRATVDPMAAKPIEPTSITAEAIEQQLYWRDGKIAFSDSTLAAAAAEFARYNDERIVIADPELADEAITGLFVANDPQGFAEAVAESLGLVARTEGKTIILSAT